MGLVSKVQAEVQQADDKCTTFGVIPSQSHSILRSVNMLGSQGNISFNLTFLKRFWRMHRLFYSLNTITSIAIFILFIGLSVADVFVGYRVGLISGNFYSVLVDKDSSRFLNTVLWSSLLILVISLIKALKPWLANRLTARWRQSLTSVLQTTYLKNLIFYRVKNSFENPDQRLTADIASMTDSFGSLVKNDLFVLPGAIIYYAYKAYGAAGWIGPTGMFGLFLISLINKTSILRVIRGLWEANQGQVKLDSSLDVFFFPQEAWLPPTSLRELVTGDSRVREEKKGDAEVKELLELTGLGHLISVAGGLDGKEQQKKGIQKKEQHWTTCLSPGERQRLLFSRLLFRRPSLALLDEASSAIGEEIEARLYGALKERGITVVTIGHRSCLRALHDQQITLDSKGGWELTSLRTDTIE